MAKEKVKTKKAAVKKNDAKKPVEKRVLQNPVPGVLGEDLPTDTQAWERGIEIPCEKPE